MTTVRKPDRRHTEDTHGDTQKIYHMLTEAQTGVIQQPVKNSQELIITNKSWGASRKDSPSEPPEVTNFADTFKSDLYPPELWENTLLLFRSLTQLVVLCYDNPSKLIQSLVPWSGCPCSKHLKMWMWLCNRIMIGSWKRFEVNVKTKKQN